MAVSWLCGRESSVSGEQGVVKGGLKGQGGAVESWRGYGSLLWLGGGSGVGARRGAWADSKCGATAVCACARVKTPGACLLSAAEAMPREQGSMATCRVEYGGVHDWYGGDVSGRAAAWSA
jgi:hypothetical protein